MCRLYGFRATEETKVECSLVHAQNALLLQSRTDQRGGSNPDGWGIAFYHNERPTVERRATAAFEDLYFSDTAERVYSKTVLAHVRDATVGKMSPLNSHPFSYGVWAFAHNGTVQGFEHLQNELLNETDPALRSRIQGQTDSEHAFFWLLTRIHAAGLPLEHPCPDLQKLAHVFARAVSDLAQRCRSAAPDEVEKLNFVITDGASMLVSRWNNSLSWVLREGIHDCELCGIPHVHHHGGTPYRAVVAASEPITHEQWLELPNEHLLAISPDVHPQVGSIVELAEQDTAVYKATREP